jgi:hypothetical protein
MRGTSIVHHYFSQITTITLKLKLTLNRENITFRFPSTESMRRASIFRWGGREGNKEQKDVTLALLMTFGSGSAVYGDPSRHVLNGGQFVQKPFAAMTWGSFFRSTRGA